MTDTRRRNPIADWTAQHAGHRIVAQRRRRPDGQPYRWCRTCQPGRDVDPVAVLRAVAGDPPGRLTPAERRAAVTQLRPSLSGAQLAHLLGVTPRTVWRDIAANRTTTED